MAAERPHGQTSPHNWLFSELGARVASGSILAAVALSATYLGGWAFALLWLLAGIAVLLEWLAMAGIPLVALMLLPIALTAALVALTAMVMGLTSAIEAITFAGVVVLGACTSSPVRRQLSRRDRLWAAAGVACAAVIVTAPPLVRDDPQLGVVGVLWMFAVVWTTDIAAYFTGRAIGGPKLWPRISPGKTWSGFAGGLVAGTSAGLAVALLGMRAGWEPPLPILWIAALSAVASAAGQAGDLAESALKRHFGVKDSGQLIPGHGGVMDRLDAFWAVAFFVGLALAGARLIP